MTSTLTKRLLTLVLLLLPLSARAHGGLPVSEQIIWNGDQMIVPTQYWGIFFGTDGGPWRWICEEAVNGDQQRVWTRAGSGAYHVNYFLGVTSSRDGGCTWITATGDISTRHVTSFFADPVEPQRVWAATGEGGDVPWNALYTTTDDGLSWMPVIEKDEYLYGVVVSGDGMTIYLTGTPRPNADAGVTGIPPTVLHVSRDRGMTFTDHAIDFPLDGQQAVVAPLAIDPADAGTVYLSATGAPSASLLVAKGFGATISKGFDVVPPPVDMAGVITPRVGLVYSVAFDTTRGSVLAATSFGLLRAKSGGAFVPTSALTRAQCVSLHGAAIYVCGYNYAPDLAAIARSDDGGDTFTPVFRYDETVGPVTTCGGATPVALTCPGIWQMYADQLGVGIGPSVDASASMSADASTISPPPSACHCRAGARSSKHSNIEILMGICVLGLLAARRSRRGSRDQTR